MAHADWLKHLLLVTDGFFPAQLMAHVSNQVQEWNVCHSIWQITCVLSQNIPH